MACVCSHIRDKVLFEYQSGCIIELPQNTINSTSSLYQFKMEIYMLWWKPESSSLMVRRILYLNFLMFWSGISCQYLQYLFSCQNLWFMTSISVWAHLYFLDGKLEETLLWALARCPMCQLKYYCSVCNSLPNTNWWSIELFY